MRVSHDMYDNVFGVLYLGMLGNLLVALACAPLLVVLFTTDPAQTWPLLVVLAPICAPALVAMFTMFTHFSDDGPVALAHSFVRGWRRSLGRSLGVGALTSLAAAVLAGDVAISGHSHALAVLIPFFVVLGSLVIATSLLALVGLAERPAARARDIVKPAVYLAVRRWHLTALSLFVIWLLGSIIAARPGIGLGFVTAPMLYVVWANGRFVLQPILRGDVS